MEPLLTISDLVEIIKVKEKTIRKYVLENSIPYIKVMGFIRFRPTEIEKWLDERKKNTKRIATNKNPKLQGGSADEEKQ